MNHTWWTVGYGNTENFKLWLDFLKWPSLIASENGQFWYCLFNRLSTRFKPQPALRMIFKKLRFSNQKKKPDRIKLTNQIKGLHKSIIDRIKPFIFRFNCEPAKGRQGLKIKTLICWIILSVLFELSSDVFSIPRLLQSLQYFFDFFKVFKIFKFSAFFLFNNPSVILSGDFSLSTFSEYFSGLVVESCFSF